MITVVTLHIYERKPTEISVMATVFSNLSPVTLKLRFHFFRPYRPAVVCEN